MAETLTIRTSTSTDVIKVVEQGPQGPAGAPGAGLSTLTTKGDTLYRGETTGERLPIGSTGQVLKVSAQGLPTWANESGAVTSVNGATGAVTVAAAQHAAEHEAGEADAIYAFAALVQTDVAALNGVYFNDGATTVGGKDVFFKTGSRKNTKLQYNSGTNQWNLVRNLTIEAVGVDGPDTVPWGNAWEDFVTPTTVTVTRLALETMVQRLAETGVAATATTSEDGLMSSSDKTKLNGIAANATANTASSATPSALGSASSGNSSDYARADHVHSAEVSDSAFRVTGSTDATKKVAIEVDTNVPSGQTVTLTAPSASGTLALAGAAPSAHAASHAATGSDPLAPSDIGAQSLFTTTNYNITGSGSFTLTAARAQIAIIENYSGAKTVTLPTSGNQSGDIAVVRANPSIGTLTVAGAVGGSQTIPTTGSRRYVYDGTNWQLDPVYTHIHEASDITSGTLAYARGGLAADVAAYNGLVKISGGSTSAVGIGTGSTEVAAGNHGHGNITSDGKIGSTAGLPVVTTTAGAVTTLALGTANQVLRVNSGATGVEFADPAAAGVTGAAASASDVLGVSGANITGVDANADRIVYWNNTANKLAYGTPADAGAAAASHTHAASDITSGTIDTARLASGTANSGTFLRGDQTWAAVSGVTTGSVDNAVLRADGTGGSSSQSSDISILDATTSTQNNVAITNEHSGQTNSSLVLGVKGTGAFIVSPARPDGAATGGNARGASAICIQTGARSANTNVASALESIAIGKNTKVTGSYGIAIGSGSYAPSTAVCIGYGGGVDANEGTAIGDRAYALGQGFSGGYLAGFGGYASGAVIIGGNANTSATNAVALGLLASGSLRSGFFTRPFNAIYWSGQTTTNAATILNLDGTATNRFTIAASTALAVDILLVARRATTQDKWLVARRFLGIRRDGSNNTALIGAVQTLGTDQSAGSPTWTFALTADDTNEALQLEVTGATGETVEWRATAFYRVA